MNQTSVEEVRARQSEVECGRVWQNDVECGRLCLRKARVKLMGIE